MPVKYAKASAPICVADSPIVMLIKDVQCAKEPSPMWVTDSPMLMLVKYVHAAKAKAPMCFTEPSMLTKTSWLQFRKAYLEISVRLQGIFTPKNLCVWMRSMSSFVAASTSFLAYATVTSDSVQNNPAASSLSIIYDWGVSQQFHFQDFALNWILTRMLLKEHRLQLPNSSRDRNVKGDDTTLYGVQLYFTRHGCKRKMDPRLFSGPDLFSHLVLWTPTIWKEPLLGGITFQASQTPIGWWFWENSQSQRQTIRSIQNPVCFSFCFTVLFGDLGGWFLEKPGNKNDQISRREKYCIWSKASKWLVQTCDSKASSRRLLLHLYGGWKKKLHLMECIGMDPWANAYDVSHA